MLYDLTVPAYQDGLSALSAELSRARAKADQFIAVIQLYKSLGGGWNVETDKWAETPP